MTDTRIIDNIIEELQLYIDNIKTNRDKIYHLLDNMELDIQLLEGQIEVLRSI